MTALWNKSLAARFVGVMLLALALSQGVSLLLFSNERDEALFRSAKAEFLSRSASVAKVLETTPPSVHSDILRASGTGYSRFWITPDFPADSGAWRRDAKLRLGEPLPTVQKLANPGSAEPLRQEPVAAAAAPTQDGTSTQPWADLPPHAWPLSRAAKFLYLDRPYTIGMGLTVQLADGQWLNTALNKKMTNGIWTSRSAISLGVTAVIISICAALIAQGMSRPMRRLAGAAEALGRGENVPPLPEHGPDDIRNTTEAFNRMQARLQRFVEDRTRMLAAIGHDLRTPLTSLRLRAEFVTDEETREKMLTTLDELRHMTEATLALSRDQAFEEPTRNVDLSALVQSLCDDLAELGQEVSFDGAPTTGYRCRADSLKRALRNLIENAVRYGERARVRLEAAPETISIIIEDDGPGIPESEMESVFAPFFRLEESRNRETGGIGLGLSIARDIVRHHGGDISLANTGRGLRAEILLPQALQPAVMRSAGAAETAASPVGVPLNSPAE
jgi:signal transduction histidine kinase